MKILLVTGLLFCLSTFVNAQTRLAGKGKIYGVVVDSLSKAPLDYATISVFLKGEKKPLTGSTTNISGKFEITGIANGNLTVVAEFIGYNILTLDDILIDKDHQTIDLKTIALSKKQTTLKAVSITVQGKLVENKIDKIIFNAERDLTSQTGVATDVLKKVPQVSVDVNGNVELAGSSSIRFLIDGKPSSAFGSNISDVLQSIPASQIKSIEVITNPGARYDAQGLGGIINIILKKSNARGINGNLSLSAGTRMDNGSFNFNARRGTFGFNAFVSGNVRTSAKTLTVLDRTSGDTSGINKVLLHQVGKNNFRRNGYQTGAGFDWTYKETHNFSGAFSFNNFGNNGAGLLQQTISNYNNGNLNSITTIRNDNKNNFRFHNADASLNYKNTSLEHIVV